MEGRLGDPVVRGIETAALTLEGPLGTGSTVAVLTTAVAAAVEIKDDKLAGRGTAGDEYGDKDIVAGQMVVYAGTVTVVTTA